MNSLYKEVQEIRDSKELSVEDKIISILEDMRDDVRAIRALLEDKKEA